MVIMIKMKAPYIFIPRRHQASPNERRIYLPSETNKNNFSKPKDLVSDTDLRAGLNIDRSSIHGLGLFAHKTFQTNNLIWYERLHRNAVRIEDEGPLRWANHSDNPNSSLILNDASSLEVRLIALSQISVGEEITYDYNIFGHTGYKTACRCGYGACGGSFALRTEWGERK